MSIESAVEGGRRLMLATMLDSCTIKRRVLASDGAGGQTNDHVVLASAVPCRFGIPIDPQPYRLMDEVFGPPSASMLLPLGTDVKEGDHIVNEVTGDVWLVVGDKTPASAMAVATRLNIREV